MEAIVNRNFGSPDILKCEEIEKPTAGDGEVLIKVRAASVNPVGWHLMRGAVASACTPLRNCLDQSAVQGHNPYMRALASILVAAAILFGVYEYYLRKMPVTDEGTASTQAINLTGVRTDLMQIAQAERGYIAMNSHCGAFDELISSNALTITKPEREAYSYSIECSGTDFTVFARHVAAPSGSAIRYPNLTIDQNMQIREVN